MIRQFSLHNQFQRFVRRDANMEHVIFPENASKFL